MGFLRTFNANARTILLRQLIGSWAVTPASDSSVNSDISSEEGGSGPDDEGDPDLEARRSSRKRHPVDYRVRVEPPQLTPRLTFIDQDREAAYVDTELRPRYAARLVLTGFFFAAFFAIVTSAEAASAGASAVEDAVFWLSVGATGLSLGLSALGLAMSRSDLPVSAVEVVIVLVLGLQSTLLSLAYSPARLQALTGETPDEARARFVLNSGETALHVLLIPLAAGIFLPMQAVPFALLCVYNVLLRITLAVVVGNADALDGGHTTQTATHEVENTSIFVLLLIAALAGRLAHIISHRSQFHFHRAVMTSAKEARHAARERRALSEAEAEHRLELQSAEAARHARSRLIRMVMHDLRSPLLAVANIAATLSELPPSARLDQGSTQASIAALSKMSTLMQHIISDMLDFERIDSGRLVLVRGAFLLEQLLNDAVTTFEGLAKSKGVALRIKPLPSELSSQHVLGDARRLQQCVNNGVSNALKFTTRGGEISLGVAFTPADAPKVPPAMRVTFRERAPSEEVGSKDVLASFSENGADESARGVEESTVAHHLPEPGEDGSMSKQLLQVSLSVTDTGIGLDPTELKTLRLGGLFQQVGKGQLQGSGGTGLGLSITRQILDMHDASTLYIDSAGPGKGTTFELRLRLPTAPPPQQGPQQHTGPGSSGAFSPSLALSPRGHSRDADATTGWALPPDFRCLYVDDDRFLQLTLPPRIFGPLDVQHDIAQNGAEAVEMATRPGAKYNLILIDNQMPTMSGTLATRQLRALGFKGRIIGMTGDPAGCSERDEFEASGLDSCIDKDEKGVAHVLDVLERFMVPASAAEARTPPSRRRSGQSQDTPLESKQHGRRRMMTDQHVGAHARPVADDDDDDPVPRPRRRHHTIGHRSQVLPDFAGDDDLERARPRTLSLFMLPNDGAVQGGTLLHDSAIALGVGDVSTAIPDSTTASQDLGVGDVSRAIPDVASNTTSQGTIALGG